MMSEPDASPIDTVFHLAASAKGGENGLRGVEYKRRVLSQFNAQALPASDESSAHPTTSPEFHRR